MTSRERDITLIVAAAILLFFVPKFRPMITGAAVAKAKQMGLLP